MPLEGFICPLNEENVSLTECSRCPEPCQPLPLLLALKADRQVVPHVYSTTTIISPPKVVHLKRTKPYWVGPDDMVWLMYGTAMHLVISEQEKRLAEEGERENWIVEGEGRFGVPFETPHGTALLTGTPDLYDQKRKILYDFKTMKFFYTGKYFLEKGEIKEEYDWQLNIYRLMAFPGAEKMEIKAIVKDWDKTLSAKYSCPPILTMKVPIRPEGEVRNYIQARLDELMAVEVGEKSPRLCTHDEKWWSEKAGVYRRCTQYCPVNVYCEEYKDGLNQTREKTTR